jgi:hypothetical protein
MTAGWFSRLATGLTAAVVLVVPPETGVIRVTPIVANGEVSVSFSAQGALEEDTRELVQSGLLMTLAFTIDLKKPSAAWFDADVATVDLASSVKFDNLTGVYHVSRLRGGQVFWSERTPEYDSASTWLTTFEKVSVADGSALQPNTEYYIRVRMRASPRRTFPLWPWTSDDGSGRAAFTYIH